MRVPIPTGALLGGPSFGARIREQSLPHRQKASVVHLGKGLPTHSLQASLLFGGWIGGIGREAVFLWMSPPILRWPHKHVSVLLLLT